MFKRWFWNLFLFAINVFGFIMLSWFISGLVMHNIDNDKTNTLQEEKSQKITKEQNFNYDETLICIQDKCIIAKIADTKEKREYGLMFKRSIKETEGMIFAYSEESSRSFYMRNMSFPIEILWLDSNKKINHIEHAFPCNTQNCIKYDYPAKYVIEVKDGFIENNNINLGDYATFDLTKKE